MNWTLFIVGCITGVMVVVVLGAISTVFLAYFENSIRKEIKINPIIMNLRADVVRLSSRIGTLSRHAQCP